MATARRHSNVERSRWRTKCRQVLCNHINSTLGITLDPSQVRLHPSRDDPYRWSVSPGKEYLFEKNLSDQSLGIYKELHDGINIYFEATKAPSRRLSEPLHQEMSAKTFTPGTSADFAHREAANKTTVSFTSRINELQVQRDYASQEVHLLKSQLEAEVKLRLSLEEKLQIAYERQEQLRRELEKSVRREDHFRNTAVDYSQEIAKILPTIMSLAEKTNFTQAGFI
ncbi:uncharacterized protein FMAN_15486 [Fusarium mangiferae]|uniref:Uncharacterized protein n=1 Tax=Fusarium mangiferae TaxID=192010 RepID=A0A1L7UJC8_FUSMA|nr:uncharacterized protein FMAN_15486 [Fusarium mangiferae]CVL09322.1 uncharacterized protein FMAN_15486 [Fusarium mangiferae]